MLFDSLILLLGRGMTDSDAGKRKGTKLATMVVLRFLETPTGCCCTFLEDYFEYRPPRGQLDCEHYCSFCLREVREFTGIFHTIKLVSFLSKIISGSAERPRYRTYIKAMKEHKNDTFHVGCIPNKFMGPIHALALQLVAKGIIGIEGSDLTKFGTDKY